VVNPFLFVETAQPDLEGTIRPKHLDAVVADVNDQSGGRVAQLRHLGQVSSQIEARKLIDTTTGAHTWADRFDGSLDDIFELQDQVASNVVGAMESRLRLSEIQRAGRKPTDSLDVYRALPEFHKHSAEGMREAVTLLKRDRISRAQPLAS
jgi:hypothetical protein